MSLRLFAGLILIAGLASCRSQQWPPGVQDVSDESPPRTPEEALETFIVAPGFDLELVASEPMIEDPVAIDFDADGRMYVVEMRGYMPNVEGDGELTPNGRVSVLEDTDADGRMDRSTVFLDSLVLPRAVKALDHGVLVAEPPYLWLARDTTGDLKADAMEVVRDDYGRRESNPERNPNGLVWALDNWIVNTWYDHRIRVDRGGRWTSVRTLDRGQWGVTMDDYGRIYRNWNESPLHIDLLPAHYLARNPHLERTSGAYVDIVEDHTVWPIRPTPGVNRGYRDDVLREDGTLRTFTASGSPVTYRGDRLPSDLLNDVFISEPAGNLVRRFDVEEEEGMPQAVNAYEGAEFIASTDERFRPVNLYSAPDGTLYVVDMYRGISQHRQYLTEYLEDQIRRRDLARPLGLGRVYRVVHEDHAPGPIPQLSSMDTRELVDLLSHPNGWWRDTAQRLLVERGDTSEAAALRRLAEQGADERFRLHALWTLDGLGVADARTVRTALKDSSDHVRASAVRLAERAAPALVAGLMDDGSPVVYRQVAASLGNLSISKAAGALEEVLVRHGSDPIVVDAALSGMHGREMEFIERLLGRPDAEVLSDAVAMAAAAALNGGERYQLFTWIGQAERPAWQRSALLEGILEFAPAPPRSGDRWGRFEPITLERRPEGLLAAVRTGDIEVQELASEAAGRFSWPGKPQPERPEVSPLSTEEEVLYERGRDSYLVTCAPCHGEDGTGGSNEGKPLAGSRWVNGSEDALIRIVLHGKEGDGLMPPMRRLGDEEIASILTYIRRSWGNQASAVSPSEVREVRGRTASRGRPWTEEELGR